MNFQQLEYALAVQQYQHFGKAAESCNITQATLSAMIKKLEGELKTQLFDRSSQPILVTEKGKEEVQEVLNSLKKQNIDLIFSSDFIRTKQTAEMIAEGLGLGKEKIIFD